MQGNARGTYECGCKVPGERSNRVIESSSISLVICSRDGDSVKGVSDFPDRMTLES